MQVFENQSTLQKCLALALVCIVAFRKRQRVRLSLVRSLFLVVLEGWKLFQTAQIFQVN